MKMKFRIGFILGTALLSRRGFNRNGRTGLVAVDGARIGSFPNCIVASRSWIGDGECDGGEYNKPECGWDGGDCDPPLAPPGYPDCYVDDRDLIGDGSCDGDDYNTEECGWDGGDCELYNSFPDCEVSDPERIGDGTCDKYDPYYSEACGWDGGDCLVDGYPDCHVLEPNRLGDGTCLGTSHYIGEGYNTEECGWDGGDCELYNSLPDCNLSNYDAGRLGDGTCSGWDEDLNSEACGWDGGDCVIDGWPDCHVEYIEKIGDGTCHGREYNTAECGWDGGDCLEFHDKYPDCRAYKASEVANGVCVFEKDSSDVNYEEDLIYSEECGWDGGDCPTPAGFPHCHLVPSYGKSWEDNDDFDVAGNCLRIGDGVCNPGQHNTVECGWDGGDCISANKLNPPPGWPAGVPTPAAFPNCYVSKPSLIGDGTCNKGPYNTRECSWDGGDCAEANKLDPPSDERMLRLR